MSRYFQPVDPGYGLIAAALSSGLQQGMAGRQQRRREDEEQRRYDTQQKQAEEERKRLLERQSLQDRLMGIHEGGVPQDAITVPGGGRVEVVAPVAAAPQPQMVGIRGGPTPIQQAAAAATEMPATTRIAGTRAREGVLDLGDGRYFDPRQSQAHLQQQLAQREQQALVEAERERRREAISQITGGDPVRTAAMLEGIDMNSNLPFAEQLRRREEELKLQERFAIREEGRRQAAALALARAKSEAREGGGLDFTNLNRAQTFAGNTASNLVTLYRGNANAALRAAQQDPFYADLMQRGILRREHFASAVQDWQQSEIRMMDPDAYNAQRPAGVYPSLNAAAGLEEDIDLNDPNIGNPRARGPQLRPMANTSPRGIFQAQEKARAALAAGASYSDVRSALEEDGYKPEQIRRIMSRREVTDPRR